MKSQNQNQDKNQYRNQHTDKNRKTAAVILAAAFMSLSIIAAGCSKEEQAPSIIEPIPQDQSAAESGAEAPAEETSSQEESTAQGESASQDEETSVSMANPWSDTLDLDEARKGSGIDFDPPITEAAPEGMSLDIYRYMQGTLETRYSGNDDKLTVRASLDMEGFELAGDYTEYSKEWEENFKGLSVLCRGDGTKINTAVFGTEDVHFAVLYNPGEEGKGLEADELKSLIMGMQAVPLGE